MSDEQKTPASVANPQPVQTTTLANQAATTSAAPTEVPKLTYGDFVVCIRSIELLQASGKLPPNSMAEIGIVYNRVMAVLKANEPIKLDAVYTVDQ